MAKATRRPAIREYTATLEAYMSSAGQFALERAYDIGRHAASGGMSLLQFSELHHAALRVLLSAPGASVQEILTRAEQFFSEGLSAFEMCLCSHRASARLLGLSDGLTRQSGELSRSRALLKTVFDATGAIVYLRDAADGCLLFVNGVFEQRFGVSEARVLGKTAHEVASSILPSLDPGRLNPRGLPPGDAQAQATVEPPVQLLRLDAQGVFSSAVPITSERTCVQAGGSQTYRTFDIPLVEPNGVVYAVCSIVADVTRAQRAEEALSLARQATDTAHRQLESVGRALAEDLLAPLRSIDGFSQALLDECSAVLDERSKAHLGNVRQSAHHMATLIDSLLAFAKFSRGELHSAER